MKKLERRRGQASVYALEQQQRLKQQAYRLYMQGRGTREVGTLVGKSRSWVSRIVRELEAENAQE